MNCDTVHNTPDINPENFYDAVIIGGGPAGLTAAIYLARACYRVIVVEKETIGGQITITSEVVNYPGILSTDGRALTETMRRQAEGFGAEFLSADVTAIRESGSDIKTVSTSRGELHCFGIIAATGARPRTVGFSGEEEFRGRGVSYCATCDGGFFTDKEIFVIGGGFAAAEESLFLTKYGSHVTMLIRGDDLKCPRSIADSVRAHEKITVLTHTSVVRAEGDHALRSLVFKNSSTGDETVYHAPDGDTFGLFVFAGYEPETELLKDLVQLDEQGYVITDRNQHTNVAGIYAAGDVCVKNLRQVVTAVSDGAVAATELEKYASLMHKKTGLCPGAADTDAAEAASQTDTCKPSSDSADNGAHADAKPDSSIFSPEMLDVIYAALPKLRSPLVLKVYQKEGSLSAELSDYMEEISRFSDKLSVSYADSSQTDIEPDELPCVRVLRSDLSWTGLAFHGAPGGHEFNSFVSGLCSASGEVGDIDAALSSRIAAAARPIDIKVMVTLPCTMCPELVTAAQKLASLNADITAEVYNVLHFTGYMSRYKIMSVPCIIAAFPETGEERVAFGSKNINELLDFLEI